MKLTGKLIHETWQERDNKAPPWDDLGDSRKATYDNVANDLNALMAEQTSEQEYRTEVQVFSADGAYPYIKVRDQANTWLAQHPSAVIIETHTNAFFAGDSRTEYSLTLVVAIPVEPETTKEEQSLTQQDIGLIGHAIRSAFLGEEQQKEMA